jgi:hypothetical protein
MSDVRRTVIGKGKEFLLALWGDPLEGCGDRSRTKV